MASLLKRGNRYYVRVYLNSKATDIATGTSNLKLAGKILKKIEYEQSTGKLERMTRTPLPKLLTDFLTHIKTNRRLKSVQNDTSRLRVMFGPLVPELEFARKFGEITGEEKGKPVSQRAGEPPRIVAEFAEQITTPLVNQYLDKRAGAVGPKTLNQEREILHRLFTYAIEHHGLIYPDPRLRNPVEGVRPRKLPAHEIRFLTIEQIAEQLNAIQEEKILHMAVAILIYAGVRREEALWLTNDDVDRKGGLLRIRAKTINGTYWQPKTGRNRAVPISIALATLLDRYDPPSNGQWFLPSPQGDRWDPDNFSHKLADANAKAKLPWTCLDFRHTFYEQRRADAAKGDVFSPAEMSLVQAAVRQFGYTQGPQRSYQVPTVMSRIARLFPSTPMAKVAMEHTHRAMTLTEKELSDSFSITIKNLSSIPEIEIFTKSDNSFTSGRMENHSYETPVSVANTRESKNNYWLAASLSVCAIILIALHAIKWRKYLSSQ